VRTALLLAAITCLLVWAVGSEAKPRVDCARTGHTITRTHEARAFRSGARVYGCLLRRGPVVRLGFEAGNVSPSGGQSVEHITIASHWIAYVRECTDYESGNDLLVVRDLRTGRIRRRISSDGGGLCAGDRTAWIGPLVLTSYGGVAWVLNRVHGPGWQSTLWDWHERYPTLIDSDPGELSDLTLQPGSVLSWTRAGQPRELLLSRSCIDCET
jgi:hypothetical protein